MVKRIVVGAHYGFRDWLAQRVTAVVMAVYTVVFVIAFAATRPADYAAWKAFFAQGWLRFATLLFFVSLFYHAWIGVRDILMDYIKPVWLRLTLEVVVILVLVGCGGWAVQVLWRG
ncbi:MAG: succinate dehydrogenase, hydrophobic membrane anchor protein [Betaproteobacteria bacterium]|jgi:succinate dehydrogenase / fumarate reductase membrane anchor subunit|nr:succinate dehydrogenase, hydrophobic membrane anchor protein [Betaproteobacteria bacterium]